MGNAAGWRLAVLPAQAGPAADAAEVCSRFVADDAEEAAYRSVIQLADWLEGQHGAERVAITVAPPFPTGDRRIDAFIAGVVGYRLDEEKLPHPRWLASAAKLDQLWNVDESTDGDPATVSATPKALREARCMGSRRRPRSQRPDPPRLSGGRRLSHWCRGTVDNRTVRTTPIRTDEFGTSRWGG